MSTDLNFDLNDAIHDFKQGYLESAKKKLTNFLIFQPDNLVALEVMGIICANLGCPQQALKHFEKITKIEPNYALGWSNLGNVQQEIKEHDQALVSYNKAISIMPENVDAWYNRGRVLQVLKQYDQALASLNQAISINIEDADAWSIRGVLLQELKQYEQALSSFDKAVSIKPDYAEAWSNRGNVLQELKQYEQALASFDKAISIWPDYAEAFSNRGSLFQELKQYEQALASFDKAISIKPDFADAWYNHGNACKELKQYEQALISYDKALNIKKDYSDALVNRGNVLQELKLYEQALASFDKAISINSDCVEAWSSRGNVLQDLKQFELALVSHDNAININPDDAQSYYNRGLLRLMLRDFDKGYKDYKYRWGRKELLGKHLKTSIPSPLKDELKGTLLLWAEQGLGDEVFYAGLLPMLAAKEVSATLLADKRLHTIFKRSFSNITLLDRNVFNNTCVETGFDAQAPISELGYWLGVNEASLKATRSPYLVSDSVKSDTIRRELLELRPGLVCGLAWKSSNEKIGKAKSISLSSFEPLLRMRGIKFVNLQYGDVHDDLQQIKSKLSVDIYQVPGMDVFHDVDGLLALIDACDIVVTTSNVTAHLAGSIGKRAAVLVPFSNGRIWYWHISDKFSFWYPSLRIFYQDNPLTWQQQIMNCSDWVKSLL